MTDAHAWASGIKRTLRRRSGPRIEGEQVLILPAGVYTKPKVTLSRKWGTGADSPCQGEMA